MNDEELDKFVREQKYIKAEIGDDVDDIDINDDENNNELEEICKETFVPNIKDDCPKQDDALKDFIKNNLKRGQLVKDVEWEPGFFLKT